MQLFHPKLLVPVAMHQCLFFVENLFYFDIGLGEFVLALLYKFLCNFELLAQGIDVKVAVFHLFHYFFELLHSSFIIEFFWHNVLIYNIVRSIPLPI